MYLTFSDLLAIGLVFMIAGLILGVSLARPGNK